MKFTKDKIEQCKKLFQEGSSVREVASALGVSTGSIQYQMKKHGLQSQYLSGVGMPKEAKPEIVPAPGYNHARFLEGNLIELEYRLKKHKAEIEDLESQYKKVKNERDDLKLELRGFEQQKQLEIQAITNAQKSGMNGIVESLKDPNILSIVAPIFGRLLEPRGIEASNGGGLALQSNVSTEKKNLLQLLVNQLAALQDEAKFNNLASLTISLAATTNYDVWLTQTMAQMVADTNANSNT
jgi:DNA repair exonuclease SbcCD ATPase subunit